MLDPPHQEEVKWNGFAFEKMNNLRILIVRNTQFLTSPKYFPNSLRLIDWGGYPSMTLPPDFSPPKLVCFKLYGGLFKFDEPVQVLFSLFYLSSNFLESYKHINYFNSHCIFLKIYLSSINFSPIS